MEGKFSYKHISVPTDILLELNRCAIGKNNIFIYTKVGMEDFTQSHIGFSV